MYNIKMFTTEEELLELTGLSDRNELWNVGFNLDDWDVGFCSDRPLDHRYGALDSEMEEIKEDYEWDSQIYSAAALDVVCEEERRVPNDDAFWLVSRMDSYCVGYCYLEYRGKHYYTVHHA